MPQRAPDPEALPRLARAVLAMPPDERARFIQTLTPAQLALVEHAVAGEAALGWRADPATMAHHLDPTYQLWAYVRLLSQRFKDACDGTSKRQLWNLPGRYGKSLLASQWGPLWQLDRTGGAARFILVSYGYSLAVENAVGIRDRLTQHQEVLTTHLKRDRRRMDRFVTDQGGGVLAAGMSGRIRGFGAGAGGGIIVDDPFKDWQEAHSANHRNKVWNQYRGTLLDRLDDEEAFIIVVHHRVHADDLTGRLLEDQELGGDQWEHVVLPAIAVEGDLLGRLPGETLEPERFTADFHARQARAMGSYLASALQQQNPSPEAGNEILREWFQLFDEPPAAPDQAITSWDLKLKDKEAGDYVVGQAWWRTASDYWLVGQLRGQWDHATTANAIALLAVRHPECRTHVVEAAGSSDEVIPQLRKALKGYEVDTVMAGRLGMNADEREQVQALRRRGMTGLVAEPVKGDKSVRARNFIAPAAEAHNVHLPARREFTPVLLDELAAFPLGAHDDMVDTMSQALRRLAKGPARASASRGKKHAPPTPSKGAVKPTPRRASAARAKRPVGRLGQMLR